MMTSRARLGFGALDGWSDVLLVVCLLPLPAAAQAMWLGTNQVLGGRIAEFVVPPNASARVEASRLHRKLDFVRGAVAVPGGFNLLKARPMLVVSVPSGASSLKSMSRYTNTALALGWLVLA